MSVITQLPPAPFTYADALAVGISRQRLRTLVEKGAIHRLRRGWYASTGTSLPCAERWEATRADHLRRLGIALADHPGCAASHASAAMVHDLPLMMSPAAEVELVRIEDAPSSRRLPGVVIHHTDSLETTTETVDGMRTTGVALSVADVLRTRRLPHGLAMLDTALRAGRLTTAEVEAVLDRQRRWVGRPRARQALALADPRRESWAESYSVGVLARAEFPVPIPQVELYDESYAFVARLDGLLDHEHVATEVDGLGKYFIGPGHLSAEERVRVNLDAETDRQHRIERLGLAVARWTVDEAMHDEEIVTGRVNRAAGEALGRPFTGWVRWEGRFCRLPLVPRD